TCSTRPSQASEAPGVWARSCTTKARLVGSGSGNWGMGDLLQHPIQAGHFHAVRGLPGREELKKLLHVLAQKDTRHYLFKTIPPSVQMWGCGTPEAFKDCSRRHSRVPRPAPLDGLWVHGDEMPYASGRSRLIACASFSPTS